MSTQYAHVFLFCLVIYTYLVCDCMCENVTEMYSEGYVTRMAEIDDSRFKPLIFYNLESALKTLSSELYRTEIAVKKLIAAFFGPCQLTSEERQRVQKLKHQPDVRRKPFIVIEGTDKLGRMAVARRVAARLGAKFLRNPPQCLLSLRTQFTYSIVLRRAYYALCMYASAIEVNRHWFDQTVVMTGYWHHQAAFSIAKAYSLHKMPDRSLRIFKWPDDLTPPDVAFFVNPTTTSIYESKYRQTFKPRLVEAYRRLRNPTLIEVGGMLFNDQMAVEVLIHLKNIFKEDYNFIINQQDPLAVNFTRMYFKK